MTSASRELVVLNLVRGTLVGDYDGTRGGTLRVRSGDVTVDVVGTLFAVETSAAGTQVSVAHGKVRVERRGEVLTLTNGQSWSTNRAKREPVPPQVAQLFERGPHRPIGAASSPRPAPSIAPAPAVLPPRPPAPVTPPPAAATPIAPVSAASLYRLAESALQSGEDARGQQLLSELVSRFPSDSAADAARFEMALIFEKTGKAEQALALTDEIVRGRAEGPSSGRRGCSAAGWPRPISPRK